MQIEDCGLLLRFLDFPGHSAQLLAIQDGPGASSSKSLIT